MSEACCWLVEIARSFWGLTVDRPKVSSEVLAFLLVSDFPGIPRVAGEAGGELVQQASYVP